MEKSPELFIKIDSHQVYTIAKPEIDSGEKVQTYLTQLYHKNIAVVVSINDLMITPDFNKRFLEQAKGEILEAIASFSDNTKKYYDERYAAIVDSFGQYDNKVYHYPIISDEKISFNEVKFYALSITEQEEKLNTILRRIYKLSWIQKVAFQGDFNNPDTKNFWAQIIASFMLVDSWLQGGFTQTPEKLAERLNRRLQKLPALAAYLLPPNQESFSRVLTRAFNIYQHLPHFSRDRARQVNGQLLKTRTISLSGSPEIPVDAVTYYVDKKEQAKVKKISQLKLKMNKHHEDFQVIHKTAKHKLGRLKLVQSALTCVNNSQSAAFALLLVEAALEDAVLYISRKSAVVLKQGDAVGALKTVAGEGAASFLNRNRSLSLRKLLNIVAPTGETVNDKLENIQAVFDCFNQLVTAEKNHLPKHASYSNLLKETMPPGQDRQSTVETEKLQYPDFTLFCMQQREQQTKEVGQAGSSYLLL